MSKIYLQTWSLGEWKARELVSGEIELSIAGSGALARMKPSEFFQLASFFSQIGENAAYSRTIEFERNHA